MLGEFCPRFQRMRIRTLQKIYLIFDFDYLRWYHLFQNVLIFVGTRQARDLESLEPELENSQNLRFNGRVDQILLVAISFTPLSEHSNTSVRSQSRLRKIYVLLIKLVNVPEVFGVFLYRCEVSPQNLVKFSLYVVESLIVCDDRRNVWWISAQRWLDFVVYEWSWEYELFFQKEIYKFIQNGQKILIYNFLPNLKLVHIFNFFNEQVNIEK